jgi:hypothetical protein
MIFFHLQKTGGTSIKKAIVELFGRTVVRGVNGREKDGTWLPLTVEQERASIWCDHMSFGLHKLMPEPVPYFTVVRDPVSREISRFRHSSWERDNGMTPMSSYRSDWGMVYQLSGIPKNNQPYLSEVHVDQALRNMRDHFLYVGDTSRMDKVDHWIRNELGWEIQSPLPHVNKADPEVEVTEEEIEEIKKHPFVQLDQMLYDRISELGSAPQEWQL